MNHLSIVHAIVGAIIATGLVWLKIGGHVNNWGILGIVLLYSICMAAPDALRKA